MATIIDPLGTPSVVYNKSGTVVIAMDATGTNAATGAAIPNVSGHINTAGAGCRCIKTSNTSWYIIYS